MTFLKLGQGDKPSEKKPLDCEVTVKDGRIRIRRSLCALLAFFFVAVPIGVGLVVWFLKPEMIEFFTNKCVGRRERACDNGESLGSRWDVTVNGIPKQCACEYPVYGMENACPSVNCRPKGCYGDDGDSYRKPGSVNNRNCTCVEGTDPKLADAYTLFHWSCPKVEEPKSGPQMDGTKTCKYEGTVVAENAKWKIIDKTVPKECVCEKVLFMGEDNEQPTVACRELGCLVDTKFFAPGEQNGSNCTCVSGNHPLLMDGYVLYHWNC